MVVQACLLLKRSIGPANVQAPGRDVNITGNNGLDAVRVNINRGTGLNHIGDAFQTDPQARITAHGPAMKTKIKVFLHVGRVQYRYAGRLQIVFRLVGHGGRLGRVVITGNQQDPAILRRTRIVGMLEDIHGTVKARPLAIPHGKNPLFFGVGEQVQLLGTPNRGGGQFFIDTRLENNIVFIQVLLCFPQG